jgi:hypothetical protein
VDSCFRRNDKDVVEAGDEGGEIFRAEEAGGAAADIEGLE